MQWGEAVAAFSMDPYLPQSAQREDPAARALTLPPPQPLSASLGEALGARRSCRSFLPEPLPLTTAATALHAAYGAWGSTAWPDGVLRHDRPVPSAGGFYDLEIRLLSVRVSSLAPGLYRYVPACHVLEEIARREAHGFDAGRLCFDQGFLEGAALLLAFAAQTARSVEKYAERGLRFQILECGHAVQNVLLAAATLCIGAVPVGGFDDRAAAAAFDLEGHGLQPVYLVALGRAAGDPRSQSTRYPDGMHFA